MSEEEKHATQNHLNNAPTMIDPSLRLRRAIHASDTLLCHRILKSHPSLLHNPDSTTQGLSNTSLHLSCFLGHLSIVSLLLRLGHEDAGISLNEDHQTPLMLAAREGHTEIVNYLCTSPESREPGVERQDIRGRDAVMFASLGGYDTCLQILLTSAPEHPRPSAYFPALPPSPQMETSPLSFSGTMPQPVLAGTPAQRALLRHADIDGNTALHYASSNGHLLPLRTLLAAGADPDRRNVWNWTAVSYSATVAAEVYFKNLIIEVGSKKRVAAEVQRTGKGGGVRLVGGGGGGGSDTGDELQLQQQQRQSLPWSVMVDGGWTTKRRLAESGFDT